MGLSGLSEAKFGLERTHECNVGYLGGGGLLE